MPEKVPAKKVQPKNKKPKTNEKKKNNQVNGIKHNNNNQRHQQNVQSSKAKAKTVKNKVAAKKKTGSFFSTLFWVSAISWAILFFLYIVDFDKYTSVRNGAVVILNGTVNLLPVEVVVKGKQAYEYVRPGAELVFNSVGTVMNETSTFLNTNPLVKDHWGNVKDIMSVGGARLVDFMRTLYSQVTGTAKSTNSP